MDHNVWQVVPGINNTVREKVFGGINILELCLQRSHRSEAISSATREASGLLTRGSQLWLSHRFSAPSGVTPERHGLELFSYSITSKWERINDQTDLGFPASTWLTVNVRCDNELLSLDYVFQRQSRSSSWQSFAILPLSSSIILYSGL